MFGTCQFYCFLDDVQYLSLGSLRKDLDFFIKSQRDNLRTFRDYREEPPGSDFYTRVLHSHFKRAKIAHKDEFVVLDHYQVDFKIREEGVDMLLEVNGDVHFSHTEKRLDKKLLIKKVLILYYETLPYVELNFREKQEKEIALKKLSYVRFAREAQGSTKEREKMREFLKELTK